MRLYEVEEINYKNDYSCFSKVVFFKFLRSAVCLAIRDSDVIIDQNILLKDFGHKSIDEIEKKMALKEKNSVSFLSDRYKDLLLRGISIIDILQLDYETNKPILDYRNSKLIVTKIEDDRTITKNSRIIRFYILPDDSEKNHDVRIDVGIDFNGIKQIIVHNNGYPLFLQDEEEIIKYFCHKYFNLLRENVSIREILKIDNNETFIYKPSIINSFKRVLRKDTFKKAI